MHDVKIKNRSNQVSERTALIAAGYDENTSIDSISNSIKNVKKPSKDSDENAKYSLSEDFDIEQFLFDAELTLINSNPRRLIKHNGNYRHRITHRNPSFNIHYSRNGQPKESGY